MPNYTIPPWLAKDNDIAGKFAQGVHLGAQIQQANVSLQAQAQEAQMRMDQAAKQNEQNFYLRQQELQVQQAQHQQETALRQQALADAHQKVQLEVQAAQRQYAAQKIISAAPPEEQGKLIMQNWFDLGGTGAGFGTAYKAINPPAQIPASIKAAQYGKYSGWEVTQAGGKKEFHQGRDEKPASDVLDRQLTMNRQNFYEKRLAKLESDQEKDLMGERAASKPESKNDSDQTRRDRARYLERKSKIDEWNRRIESGFDKVEAAVPEGVDPEAAQASAERQQPLPQSPPKGGAGPKIKVISITPVAGAEPVQEEGPKPVAEADWMKKVMGDRRVKASDRKNRAWESLALPIAKRIGLPAQLVGSSNIQASMGDQPIAKALVEGKYEPLGLTREQILDWWKKQPKEEKEKMYAESLENL